MSNQWFPNGRPSAACGRPPPAPPDQPDPALLPINFPPLSPTAQGSHAERRQSTTISTPSNVVMLDQSDNTVQDQNPSVVLPEETTQTLDKSEVRSRATVHNKGFTVHNPKNTSPLSTNKASSGNASLGNFHFRSSNKSTDSTTTPNSKDNRLRSKVDRSLRREGPLVVPGSVRPSVLIPEEVYARGAELHKEFMSCFFCGRAPPYKQIQSVINHMWGKGKHIEIHTSLLSNSMIVRVPNDFIREKILEKKIWYIGDSMFHVHAWGSSQAASPSLTAMPLWAHLRNVPLDLRSLKGLGWVAGALGNPKETDDFTINLVSLVLSHVKVEMDLTLPLPRTIELPRANGGMAIVEVDYPWVPS
ncbi:hypothetical protein N665_0684s0007 [Sinapis alba]|nr:hypothetical protein N665_0684s0007 [Sinapis alba]